MIDIKKEFLETIENRIRTKYEKFSVSLLIEELKNSKDSASFSKGTIYEFWKTRRGSMATANELAIFVGMKSYHDFVQQLIKKEKVKSLLSGIWVSYRFSGYRHLKKSRWEFIYDKEDDSLTVEKLTTDGVFEGKFSIGSDNLLSGTLSDGSTHLFYSTYIEDLSSISQIAFNLTFHKKPDVYFSQELLMKCNSTGIQPTILHNRIQFKPDLNGRPSNQAYIAYNYLSNTSGHSRTKAHPPVPNYEHSIFLSCPIRSLYHEKQEEFDGLKENIRGIYSVLKTELKFKKQDIHCEMLKAEFNDIQKEETSIFLESKSNINKTHFLSILPEVLNTKNSGALFEIYYRVSNKLPCLIFYDPAVKFPSVLKGFMDGKKQNNVMFKEKKADEIKDYILHNKFNILDFNLS